MTSQYFKFQRLFNDLTPARQLEELVDYVLEASPGVQGDVDLFNERLARYARKAGITRETARHNVRTMAGNVTQARLIQYGLGQVQEE